MTNHSKCALGSTWRTSVGEDAVTSRHADPDDSASEHGEEHQRTATKTIGLRGSEDSEDELHADNTESQVLLGNWRCNAGSVQDRGQEVRDDGVSGPLTEDGEDDVDADTIAGCAAVEQRTVIPPALVGAIKLEMLLVLEHLQSHPWAVRVAMAVVLDEEVLALVDLVVHVVPTWALRQQENEDADEPTEHQLEPDRKKPARVASHLQGTTTSARCDDSTSEPERVVKGSDNT